MFCENCHQDILNAVQECPLCGNFLQVPTATIEHEPFDERLADTRWGMINFDNDFELVFLAGNRSIRLQLPQGFSVVIGRGYASHPKNTTGINRNPFIKSDTELIEQTDEQSFFVGLPQTTGQAGVSRQHIIVHNEGYFLTIMDLHSTNGSWLNGIQLLPNQKRLLRNGDLLQLGNLRLKVIFNDQR